MKLRGGHDLLSRVRHYNSQESVVQTFFLLFFSDDAFRHFLMQMFLCFIHLTEKCIPTCDMVTKDFIYYCDEQDTSIKYLHSNGRCLSFYG